MASDLEYEEAEAGFYAREEDRMDETTARTIAGYWHGGQWSALYAFTSTGHRAEDLQAEVRQCLAEVKAHPGLYVDQDRQELRALGIYLGAISS